MFTEKFYKSEDTILLRDILEKTGEKITKRLEEIEKARDQSYVLHREIIKLAGKSIKTVHMGEKEKAKELLEMARQKMVEANEAVEGLDEVPRSGFIHDAQKEYVEAAVTTAIVFGEDIPDPDEMGVLYSAYLNGISEVIGELRREVLDLMRHDEWDKGEIFLEAMDDIYTFLVSMDFSDSITHGLRRSVDQARGILERTRGDFTNFIVSKRLRDDLHKNINEK